MSNSLEERLKEHSSAFDSLLSLIPAKYFYDDATQDQWQQKKASKAEAKQKKRAKFNPSIKENADEYLNSYATAKDVMENKSQKQSATHASEQEDGLNGIAQDTSSEVLITPGTNLIFDDEGNEIASQEHELKKTPKNGSKSKKQQLSEEEEAKRRENLAKLKEKLESKINTLREKRKAVGTKATGAPTSREQILAERRRREESKLKKRKREEMDDNEDEGDDNDDSGESDDDDEKSDTEDNAVLYGNIAFSDGSQLTSNLSGIRRSAEKKKKQGPANKDIKAHLLKLEKKKRKLENMPSEEQAKQKEKDKWSRVMSQAEGVKLKDDEKLLKKALKRKEKKKLRSEIEWKERQQVVKDTVAARAKRREENLKARKEGKGQKRKNLPKLRKFTGVVNKNKNGQNNKKKRAGFEGSAKSRSKK
ncbi:Ribosomal RNA-processing protein 14 [Candida parapsilosis]|nr:Ribosomal RNA-processing protein 14 [Candida parapsilosis]